MKAIEKLARASHLIDMDDIIREEIPLRAVAEDVTFLCLIREIILGGKMMQFLHHSQDPVMAEAWPPWREWDLPHHSWRSQNGLSLFWFPIQKMPMQPAKKSLQPSSHVQSKGCRPFCARCGA